MNRHARIQSIKKQAQLAWDAGVCDYTDTIVRLWNHFSRESEGDFTMLNPMNEWRDFVIDAGISALDIACFDHSDEYFFMWNGKICSAASEWDFTRSCYIDVCFDWYAENQQRYDTALAIIRGDAYLVNDIDANLYI